MQVRSTTQERQVYRADRLPAERGRLTNRLQRKRSQATTLLLLTENLLFTVALVKRTGFSMIALVVNDWMFPDGRK